MSKTKELFNFPFFCTILIISYIEAKEVPQSYPVRLIDIFIYFLILPLLDLEMRDYGWNAWVSKDEEI